MRITFDIPDSTKTFHGSLVFDAGTERFDMRMVSWDLSTLEIEDGMIIKVPGGERLDVKDGEQK